MSEILHLSGAIPLLLVENKKNSETVREAGLLAMAVQNGDNLEIKLLKNGETRSIPLYHTIPVAPSGLIAVSDEAVHTTEQWKQLFQRFPKVMWIPCGTFSLEQVGELSRHSAVCAVCVRNAAADLSDQLCAQWRSAVLGYHFAHIGIHCKEPVIAENTADNLCQIFNFPSRDLGKSIVVEGSFEIIKKSHAEETGHIGIAVNSIPRAIEDLRLKGIAVDENTAVQRNGHVVSIYLRERIGGFSFHLLRKT